MNIRRHGLPVGDQGIQGSACGFFRSERGGRSRGCTGFLAITLLLSGSSGVLAANEFSEQDTLAEAEAGPDSEPELALDTIVVVGTRSARPIRDVVGMVTVLNDIDLAARLVTDENSLWRYTPGVRVESSGSRFGSRSLSIRGVGGNRVLMELDGIPLQDRFAVGSVAHAGRTGAEMDFIRRIEVLRGPASSLYGSRAIGGVVAISTFDPDDLSLGPGRPGALVRGAYAGDTDSLGASALGAWREENVGLLLGLSRRDGHEPDRSADPATPDRMERERAALLAKAIFGGDPGRRVRISVDADRDETSSEMNSLAGTGRFAASTRLTGDDVVRRSGVAVDGLFEAARYRWEGAVFQRATRTRQDTIDLRENLARPVRIDRSFRYDTQIMGGRGRTLREFETPGLRHRLMLGAEVSRSELDPLRDATITGLQDGLSSNVVLGERFPLRDFPRTTRIETGFYLQDEIDSESGRWTMIPSLRYDRTRITVRDDPAWRQANPGAEPVDLTASDWSPGLGVLWRPARSVQMWGQVASGFRAPPSADLNIGLDIPLFRTRALPNPDLESESSLGWEAGVRAAARGAFVSLTGFWTDYEDFIVSLAPIGVEPATGTLLFQSQNLARARIRGVELEGAAPLGLLSDRLAAWTVGGSGYWAEGEDRRTGADLDDVGPASAVLYLDWASDSGRWEARFSGVFTRGKAREADGQQDWFRVPGHGILDLTGAWRATDRLVLRAGLFNLADRTWWRWGDVSRLPDGDPLVPALSAPGRTLSLSFSLGFGPGHP